MSARVSVTVGADGVLAIKAATTPEEQTDLGNEAARLRQAAHPGVVRLVEHRIAHDRAELYTQYAGEAVAGWRGTIPQAAGLVAAAATTVADLHDIGLVHGRLDETHVLIGADGRPRLCGFSPPTGEATPADDVAALGRLFATLLDRATTADRRGAFRWPRAQVAERRALAQLVAGANDPVVERRPTARAFARSILATMPNAELGSADPPAAPATPAAPDRGFEVRVPQRRARPARQPHGDDSDESGDADVDVNGADEVDEVFGDQSTAEFDDLFVDRPWPEGTTTPATGHETTTRLARPPARTARTARGLPFTIFLVLLVAVAAGLSIRTGGRDDAGAPGPPVLSPRNSGRSCAPAPPPSADVDGDGCGETIRVAAGVVEIDGDSWTVGDPDDAIAIGDWDCDGRATPAAYRPSTGDVFVFADWAAVGQPATVASVAQVAGGRSLVAAPSATSDSARCDVLAVELAAGGQQVVEVGP